MDNNELNNDNKRGRGRPKKEIDLNAIAAEKRGRGRPAKPKDETAEQLEKRGRGRPKKVIDPSTLETSGEKRGRGRPAKQESTAKIDDSTPVFGFRTKSENKPAPKTDPEPKQAKAPFMKRLFGKSEPAQKHVSVAPMKQKKVSKDHSAAEAKLENHRAKNDLPVFSFRENDAPVAKPQREQQSKRPFENRESKEKQSESPKTEAPKAKKLFGNSTSRIENDRPVAEVSEPISASSIGIDPNEGLPMPYFRAQTGSKPTREERNDEPNETRSKGPRENRRDARPAKPANEPAKQVRKPQILEPKLAAEIQQEADSLVSFRTANGIPPQDKTERDLLGRPKRGARDKSRNGKRNDEFDENFDEFGENETDFSIEEIVAPEPVAPKTRQVVAIPSNAPQVVVREQIPILVRDGRVYLPFFFYTNVQDDQKMFASEEQIKDAYESGMRVFVHQINLEVNADSSQEITAWATKIFEQTLAWAPDSQVIFKLSFCTRPGWENQFPKAKYKLLNGKLADPSFSDTDFWAAAEERVTELVSALSAHKNADHLMGFQIDRGQWFNAAGVGYDNSEAALTGFSNWVRARYRNDVVGLCAAWFDGKATFDSLEIPAYSSEHHKGEQFVRTGRKTRKWVDYHLFLSDIIVERIGQLSHAIKKASNGMCVVGVSYGYTFEWSHPDSGHLSLGKLLRNPEVDYIAGPPSYKSREPGGTAAFGTPIDSIAINGKLFISEEDFKTPISGRHEPDEFNPVLKTPQALESAHWRGTGSAVAHSSGICWMDSWGNGWLKSHGTWERSNRIREALSLRMAAPVQEPDVAVFIDERSLAYLVDQKAFTLLVQDVRESILRSGLNARFYLLSDLAHRENFPEAKLYVFMNAWDVRPEVRSAIKSRLQKDGKVLFWLYAAGLFESGREALERVREITGIPIKRQPFASQSGTVLVHRKHPLCEAIPEELLAGGGTLEPSYFAIPEDGIVLAEYISTGLPSFVMKDFRSEGQNWTSVFLGESVVTPALFRALGQMAGVHTWSYQEDLVHVQAPFLSVHCRGAGNRTIALPDRFVAYSLMTQDWVPIDGLQMRFQATDGSTHNFLVGIKTDVEAILKRLMDELMKIDELPERKSDTVNLEEMFFDVPIMKLDSWIEDSYIEELAEISATEPAEETFDTRTVNSITNASGSNSHEDSGRQQRGRRRDRRQDSNRNKRTNDFDVMEMNVVFRKRD